MKISQIYYKKKKKKTIFMIYLVFYMLISFIFPFYFLPSFFAYYLLCSAVGFSHWHMLPLHTIWHTTPHPQRVNEDLISNKNIYFTLFRSFLIQVADLSLFPYITSSHCIKYWSMDEGLSQQQWPKFFLLGKGLCFCV